MEFRAHYSGSKGNLYSVVSNKGEVLLIDPGVSIKRIRECMNLSLVVGAILSHSHRDHCMAVPELMRIGVDCYMSGETARKIKNGTTHHRAQIFVPTSVFQVDNSSFYLRTFATDHDCPGSVGFVIAEGDDRLLYITDAPFVVPRFKGLSHACIEANWSSETMSEDIHPAIAKRIMRSHMSLDSALALLESNDLSNVREIWLLHLSDGNSDAEMFKDAVEKATGKPVMVA